MIRRTGFRPTERTRRRVDPRLDAGADALGLRPAVRRLVVLEGRWFDGYNLSMKGLFDWWSDVYFNTPHGYYHEQFCDVRALGAIARRVGAWEHTRVLYVGAHGTERGLYGSLDGPAGFVTRDQLLEVLAGLEGCGYDGLFVSSCGFLTAENAAVLLSGHAGIRWVAGYAGDVPFTRASALELVFLGRLLDRYTPRRWRWQLEQAVAQVERDVAGLSRELGFRVWYRPTPSSPPRPLLDHRREGPEARPRPRAGTAQGDPG
ncbi:MAG: hypothetical protein ABMB14_09820 [Myxococcota bacterium]